MELLLQNDLERRNQKGLKRRVKQARFEEVRTLAQFDFDYNPQVPARCLRDWAGCHLLEQKASVLLCGPVGIGKAFLAQALGYQAVCWAIGSASPGLLAKCRQWAPCGYPFPTAL